jgi:hypothetical protein
MVSMKADKDIVRQELQNSRRDAISILILSYIIDLVSIKAHGSRRSSIFTYMVFIKERKRLVQMHQQVAQVRQKDQLVNAQLMVLFISENDITLIMVLFQIKLLLNRCTTGKQQLANQLVEDKPVIIML